MRYLIAILAPLLLVGCILSPGKFTSTMTINADRTFAFTYQGEVIASDEYIAAVDQSASAHHIRRCKPDELAALIVLRKA